MNARNKRQLELKMINLFIYIPTYSRPIALSKQLESLFPQAKKFSNQVRIIVRDNDSKGSQFDAIKNKYQADNILFEKNFGNIGGNANIALGFVYARENEFLWILSDDDFVREDCVGYLLSKLDYSIDYVVMNDEVDYPKIMPWKWSDGWVDPINWRQGLISAALYNTNTIRQSIGDAFRYHNSSFPHLAVACSAAQKNEKVIFMHLPYSLVHNAILAPEESAGDYSLSQVGMPSLLNLFPKESGRDFARRWSHRNGWLLYRNSHKHPGLSASSRFLLVKFGGRIIHFYLFKAMLLAKVSHSMDLLAEYFRRNKCKSILRILKALSNWIGYR
jgi:hypothetical protein